MKLMTEMLLRFDGKMVVANGMDEPLGPDEVACEPDAKHDIAVAHALMQEIACLREASDITSSSSGRLVLNLLDTMERRAGERMAEWGFESEAGK